MSKKRRKKKVTPAKVRETVLKCFLKNPKKRLNAGTLINKMKVSANKDAVHTAMLALQKEGVLKQVTDNKFVLNRKHVMAKRPARQAKHKGLSGKQTYQGTVDLIRSGAGYVMVDNLESDIYVPARHINGAFNGDEVEVSTSSRSGRRKPEGKVLRVIKRNTPFVMGTVEMRKKNAKIIPASGRLMLELKVAKDDLGDAKDGDKVRVEVTHWPKGAGQTAWGAVRKVFKGIDPHNWTMESILVENGFRSEHGPQAMREAANFPEEISEEEIAKRKDFRDILTFTIDPDTAQDFDDAISYKKLDNGHVEIGVHIADVTHFLKSGTALDDEAYERSTSVYLVDRCISMLPERLSNNLCSLMPNVDRLVFSAVFTFDKKHKLISEWFGKGIIHSDKRFTYDEGQASLDDKKGLYHKELTLINKIAHKLRREKFKNGAINFETEEVKFTLDENNKPTGVYVKQRKDVHMLIEDFMLLANKRVARFITMKDHEQPVPFVYRIHDNPDHDKVANLAGFLREFGVEMDLSSPEKVSESFNELAHKAKTDDSYKLMMSMAIRTMSKAVYSTENIGHYGLRFEHYGHFTSPIRRYSDVLVHRILEKNLLGKAHRKDKNKLEARCLHISKQERKAMEAERDSIKYKQVEYISEHVGKTFEGIVSGMIDRGIFVELSDSKAEGMVSFDSMRDKYVMADGRFKAVTRNGKKTLKIGDKINVKVLSADLKERRIELAAV